MRVLLLGNSRIARRRVLPALRAALPHATISIASRSTPADQRTAEHTWYADYEEGLSRSGADLAYVSLTNDAHAEWAARALAAGMHVVVDKPAVLDVRDARALVDTARKQGRLVAEATVFGFHPQIGAVRDLLAKRGVDRRRAIAVFSFPVLLADDFRNQADKGGGALWDLGPYAAASDRLLFDAPPDRVHAEVVSRDSRGLVTAFAVLFSHGDRGALIGHFGFGTEYQNWLTVFGDGGAVTLRRAFTLPPDVAPVIELQAGDGIERLTAPAADAFAEFLIAVGDAIATGRHEPFREALERDAALLTRVRGALTAGT